MRSLSRLRAGQSYMATSHSPAMTTWKRQLQKSDAIAPGREAFARFRNNGIMPLICPTCQVVVSNVVVSNAGYFAWGCFSTLWQCALRYDLPRKRVRCSQSAARPIQSDFIMLQCRAKAAIRRHVSLPVYFSSVAQACAP